MPGYGDLKTLTRMDGASTGIYEEDVSIYKLKDQSEESKLFEVNNSIRELLQELQHKDEINGDQKDENKAQ